MNLYRYANFTIFLCLSFLGCNSSGKVGNKDLVHFEKRPIKVYTGVDTLISANEIDSLFFIFQGGFDEVSDFRVYLNKEETILFRAKSDYSIGQCILAPDFKELVHFGVSIDELRNIEQIRIEYSKEYVLIDVPKDIEKYNFLRIDRDDSWSALFERSAIPKMLY